MGAPEFVIRWIHSFLSDRQQRVKIDDVYTGWLKLKDGMPQGSWLGPYLFLVLINNLKTSVPVHKFADDTTLSEVTGKHDTSSMQSAIDELDAWSENNNNYEEDSSWSSRQVTSASTCTQQQADRPRAFIQAAGCCYQRLIDLRRPRCSNLFESQ